MDRVFSVEDIPDYFWLHAPVTDQPAAAEEESSKMMNRSASAWALEQYLREATALDSSPLPPSSLKPVTADNEVVEIKNNCNPSTAAFAAGPPNVPMDSKEYHAFLRRELYLYCAHVASTREDSAAVRHDNGSQTLQLRSGHDLPKGEDKDAGGLIPSMQAMQKKSTTSGRSSRDLSDDDEVEEEAKRDRRMLSNRESARRSRKRKQAYMTGLETQVSQLIAEKSYLENLLADISQKYNEEAAGKKVLSAEVETLKAKLKMAQEIVKRVTGSNVPSFVRDFHNWYEIISFDDGSPSDTPAGAAVPAQDDPKQHFYQPAPTPPVDGNKIGRTPSKRIRGDISS